MSSGNITATLSTAVCTNDRANDSNLLRSHIALDLAGLAGYIQRARKHPTIYLQNHTPNQQRRRHLLYAYFELNPQRTPISTIEERRLSWGAGVQTALHYTALEEETTSGKQPRTHGGNEDRDGAIFCVDHDRVVVLQEGDGAAILRLRGDVPDDKSGEKQTRNKQKILVKHVMCSYK